MLVGSEEDGLPLLLIEEPEAHLHPQRQLRLMQFLQDQAGIRRPDGQKIQIIVTTHSPNLASAIKLDNLVLVQDGKAFSLAEGETELSPSDYRFLERFLDVTKANLFFARGVVIAEGDAALARAKQRWAYEPEADLARLAAAYAFGICSNHPFRDGNKRVAFLAAAIFLGLNGLDLIAPEEEVVENMLTLASNELDEETLATWIRSRVQARPR